MCLREKAASWTSGLTLVYTGGTGGWGRAGVRERDFIDSQEHLGNDSICQQMRPTDCLSEDLKVFVLLANRAKVISKTHCN